MPHGFAFELRATDGHARHGCIHTPHGPIETPAFMPVGTAGAVKALTPDQVRSTDTRIILANTYHLMLRPGVEVVARLGGLHGFMNWCHPILTDSGGFQVFSLADLRRVDDDGVSFRSHIDGAACRLDAELAIAMQNRLGADIIMSFDECPALPASRDDLLTAVRRTIAWARRSRRAHDRPDQALYGIVQGGLDLSLRGTCLDALVEIGFDGYALGGLSVGESPEEMSALLAAFVPRLPGDAPRYLMGVGTPLDIVRAVAAGVDQFDCVLPTRNGRKGYAWTSTGVVRLRNARYQTDAAPLDSACKCAACQGYSRGYLRHLFMSGEQLGGTLVSLHNIAFYQALMRRIRAAIDAREFAAWSGAMIEASRRAAADPEEPE